MKILATFIISPLTGPLSLLISSINSSNKVYKAISTGYESPPNLQPELAQYFKMQYEEKVKHAVKWKKQSRVGGPRFLKPIDF